MRISDWSSDVCSSDLFLDRFRLCGRFHNYQLHEKPLVLTVPYVRTREGGVVRVIVNRKFLVTSKRAVRYSRAGTPTQDGRKRYLSPRPSLLQAASRNNIRQAKTATRVILPAAQPIAQKGSKPRQARRA